jgi:hypothetical protein
MRDRRGRCTVAPWWHDPCLSPPHPAARSGPNQPAQPIPRAGADVDDLGPDRRRRIDTLVRPAGGGGDDLASAVLGRPDAAAHGAPANRQASATGPRCRCGAGRDQCLDDPGVLRRGQPTAPGNRRGRGVPWPAGGGGGAEPPPDGPGVGSGGVVWRRGPHPTLVAVAERPHRPGPRGGRRHRLGGVHRPHHARRRTLLGPDRVGDLLAGRRARRRAPWGTAGAAEPDHYWRAGVRGSGRAGAGATVRSGDDRVARPRADGIRGVDEPRTSHRYRGRAARLAPGARRRATRRRAARCRSERWRRTKPPHQPTQPAAILQPHQIPRRDRTSPTYTQEVRS